MGHCGKIISPFSLELLAIGLFQAQNNDNSRSADSARPLTKQAANRPPAETDGDTETPWDLAPFAHLPKREDEACPPPTRR